LPSKSAGRKSHVFSSQSKVGHWRANIPIVKDAQPGFETTGLLRKGEDHAKTQGRNFSTQARFSNAHAQAQAEF